MFQGFDLPDLYSSDQADSYVPTSSTTTTLDIAIERLKVANSKCSEHEKPMNLGPYEIPTRLDVAKLIKHKLARLFNSYHDKALHLLKDIKEATKSTKDVEKKCHGVSRFSYRQCVKGVERKCELVTKSLVTSLEIQRHNISSVIENMVCNMTGAKADPLHFVKLLSVEEASLEFALPGFLILLGSCSNYCKKSLPTSTYQKPSRHMTDQDLVVKHFLTSKNYIELIKDDQIKEKQKKVH
ncbi:hypothetical protein K1T71_013015 [Dendrolimus kikuchii]|uniref:Uncharacterized protein n=1 Tax=Dendrolimus kikuchii TaxID=765133 RepID=A0ACC1CIR1_9NEOP|nr:hypothetical protein K1T71_013015 [Dendrolimus kikuchii]